jgi:hypothetical protein
MLSRTDPARAEDLQRLSQEDVDARWRLYEQLAEVDRGPEAGAAEEPEPAEAAEAVEPAERPDGTKEVHP